MLSPSRYIAPCTVNRLYAYFHCLVCMYVCVCVCMRVLVFITECARVCIKKTSTPKSDFERTVLGHDATTPEPPAIRPADVRSRNRPPPKGSKETRRRAEITRRPFNDRRKGTSLLQLLHGRAESKPAALPLPSNFPPSFSN